MTNVALGGQTLIKLGLGHFILKNKKNVKRGKKEASVCYQNGLE